MKEKEKHIIVKEDMHKQIKAIAEKKGMTIRGLLSVWINEEK